MEEKNIGRKLKKQLAIRRTAEVYRRVNDASTASLD